MSNKSLIIGKSWLLAACLYVLLGGFHTATSQDANQRPGTQDNSDASIQPSVGNTSAAAPQTGESQSGPEQPDDVQSMGNTSFDFQPSEEISADSSVAFPVDI